MAEEQGTKTKVEGTSGANESQESTQQKEEPTGYKTEGEYNKALQTGVSKGLESMQRQLDLLKTSGEVSKAEIEAAKAALGVSKSMQEETQKALQDLEEKQFADDPDALKGYRLTKTLELREKQATLHEAELKKVEVEQDGFRAAVVLSDKASELVKQYQVPRKILGLCTTENQMEEIAQDYPAVEKEPEKKAPEFAGAGEQGKGIDWRKLSPQDQIAYGLKHNK